MSRRLLVIGAHAADFVWRSAGAIALTTSSGGSALAVALSYGERGESAELWNQPDQTIEAVKRIRHEEVLQAADVLNAHFTCFDLGDYPLQVSVDDLERLADVARQFEPDVVITHGIHDPFNPDHPVAHSAAIRAEQLAVGAGRAAAFKTIPQPQVLLFEPHYPDSSGFVPDVYLDISAVHEIKAQAMAAMRSQRYMPAYQVMRSEQRAWQAKRISGRTDITHVEVFQRFTPQVVNHL
jgi:4-oxalomesaconate hydratase